MRNIINAENAVIAAIVAFVLALAGAGIAYCAKPANVEFVGTGYAYDALVKPRSIVKLEDGRMTVSTCTEQEVRTLKLANMSRCITPKYVGDGDLLVKSVVPAHKAEMRAAMTHSMVYTSIAVVDGYVVTSGPAVVLGTAGQ